MLSLANASQLEVQNSWTTIWRSDRTHQHPNPAPGTQLTGRRWKGKSTLVYSPYVDVTLTCNARSDVRAVNLLVRCVIGELAGCQKSCDKDRMLSEDEALANRVTRLPV